MTRSLHLRRIEETIDRLRASGAESVLDLGCGSGRLLVRLLREPQFRRVAGLDICPRSLSQAADSLRAERDQHDGRLQLIHGSFTEPDDRLRGFDAAVMVETIEHLDPRRLSEVERTVFQHWRPKTVVITTPNRDFNTLFQRDARILRHRDHRFEWSREKFARWAGGVAERNGYHVTFDGIGQEHPAFGCPTQVAEFALRDAPP